MDFALTEEQQILRHSVERLFADHYAFEARKRYMQEPDGWSRTLWQRYAELGLLGLPFDEEHGGSAGGPVETMIVMEQIGRALALEPYLATVVLGRRFASAWRQQDAARRTDPADRRRRSSARLRSHRTAGALRSRRHRRRPRAVTAHPTCSTAPRAWCCTAIAAQKFIVSARLSGGQRDRDGVGLFLVDATANGVATRGYGTVDGLRAAEVTLSGVRVDVSAALGEPGAAFPLIERIADMAIAALCAEAVGAMAAMQETTVEYLKTRKQFGVTIGSFQALQHRAAEMVVDVEQARSMAMLATMMAAEDDAARATRVDFGGEGADRPLRPRRRSGSDPAARRHRHDHGGQGRPLLQARHHIDTRSATPITTSACWAPPAA